MRILSLLPAATEIVYLLGLQDQLVGVSHECDYPQEVKKKPKVTSSPVSNTLSSLEIDKKVKALTHQGSGVFHINEKVLKKLKPDLILTQELCQVCAIGFSQVQKAARVLDGDTKIISLEPESIEDIFENILLIGETCDKRQVARKAVDKLKERLKNLDSGLLKLETPKEPRVLIIEWLDPLMVAGHWVPEMVEKAGGINLITKPEDKSYPITTDQLIKSNPEIIIFAPCGFSIKRTLKEIEVINGLVSKLQSVDCKLFLMDGNSYLTRPGPRIIDGVEILSEILNPETFPKKHTNFSWITLRNTSW